MFGFHQVTIYRVDPNTSRADIEADIVRGPTANYVIDDAAGVDIVSTARRDFEHVGAIHDHLTNPSAFVLQATHPADASITCSMRTRLLTSKCYSGSLAGILFFAQSRDILTTRCLVS